MITLITGSLVMSVLHALIPNHWLPVLAISKKENWTLNQTTFVTLASGLAHALSTVLIGVAIAVLGVKLSSMVENFTRYVAPGVLITIGLFYIYQHHRHKHFKLYRQPVEKEKSKVILTLAIAMFFSPCFEIEAYFLLAGTHGWWMVFVLASLYSIVTVIGMILWVRFTYKGLLKLNWHTLEHNAGIITGITLLLTGILSFFIH
jgi:nickel/cobalt transporter (NicO) family protein